MQALPHPNGTRAATRGSTSRTSIACATAALIALLLSACAAPSSNTNNSGSNTNSSQASTEDGRLVSDNLNIFSFNLPRNWTDKVHQPLNETQLLAGRFYFKSDVFDLLDISTEIKSYTTGNSSCRFSLIKAMEKTDLTNQGMEQYLKLSEEKLLETTIKQNLSKVTRFPSSNLPVHLALKSVKLLASVPFIAGAHHGWLQQREVTIDGVLTPPHIIAVILPFRPTTNQSNVNTLHIRCWLHGTHTKEPVFGSSMHDKLLAIFSTIQIKHPPLEQAEAK